MHDDRHFVGVGCAKYLAELVDVFRIVKIDIRIAEVQLDTGFQVRIPRTTIYLGQGVVAKRVNPANTDETVGVLFDLLSRPIVFGLNRRILIPKPGTIGITKLVGERENNRAPNAAASICAIRSPARNGLGSPISFATTGLSRCW
jgi:hypothetical protein